MSFLLRACCGLGLWADKVSTCLLYDWMFSLVRTHPRNIYFSVSCLKYKPGAVPEQESTTPCTHSPTLPPPMFLSAYTHTHTAADGAGGGSFKIKHFSVYYERRAGKREETRGQDKRCEDWQQKRKDTRFAIFEWRELMKMKTTSEVFFVCVCWRPIRRHKLWSVCRETDGVKQCLNFLPLTSKLQPYRSDVNLYYNTPVLNWASDLSRSVISQHTHVSLHTLAK